MAVVGTGAAATAEEAFLTVTMGPGETIREVAETYLGDPDLWPEILRASGIESIADLEPGSTLKVPANEVTAANQALRAAVAEIQTANASGAQIFAPDEIGQAVELHQQALEQRLDRAWQEARASAEAAREAAVAAAAIAEEKRDQAAEALVTDRTGRFEGQRPEDLSWRDLQLRAILIEEEKVRTLSDSTAQITFRDASRLRLNENSNAVIKQMRFDPWRRTQDATVSLVEGDFYALLAGSGDDRRNFDVEVPQVEAVINSGNFWVSNDDESAKFANYDDDTVAIAANGGTVTLGQNQSTVVEHGAAPSASLAVLPPPALLAPENEGPVYVPAPELSWSPVDGAAGYWVEIARDQEFRDIVENAFGVAGPHHVAQPLPLGEFFWRVSALDSFGIPGARGPTWRFSVTPDDTAPYLRVAGPARQAIVREPSVTVSGASEPGATITVNGAAAAIDDDGRFEASVALAPGDNAIVVVAADPAGNTSRDERRIVHMPDEASTVAFDPGLRTIGPQHFLAKGQVISLRGRTTANADIAVRAEDGTRASAVAGTDGAFQVNVPLTADSERLDFVVIAPSGFETVVEIAVDVDRDGPAIVLDEPLPWLTAEPSIPIAGTVEEGAVLTLNGDPLPVAEGRFSATVALQPGANPVELVAVDAAGNVGLETSVVNLDREPPRLVSTAADRAAAGSGVLVIEVVAEDASGLAAAAPVVVTVGGRAYQGFLRYNRAAGRYQGQVAVPAADLEAAHLSRVSLEDDAGNRTVIDVPQPGE